MTPRSLEDLPLASVPCRPPRWAASGHAQTLLGNFWPTALPERPSSAHEVLLADGDRLRVRGFAGKRDVLVCVFHGLGGHDKRPYVRRVAALCGALALCQLLREGIRPQRGRLTVAFANVAAFSRFDAADPHRARCVDEDLNRVWADEVLLGPRDSAELRRARELRPFVDAADLLLDIHSMGEPCRPLMVCGQSAKNARYACELGMPADLLLDTGHPAGLRMVERGGFGDAASAKRALLIECGQHWERASEAVAWDTTLRFLALTGLVDAAWAASRCSLPLPAQQQVVQVSEPVVAKSSAGFVASPPTCSGRRSKGTEPWWAARSGPRRRADPRVRAAHQLSEFRKVVEPVGSGSGVAELPRS